MMEKPSPKPLSEPLNCPLKFCKNYQCPYRRLLYHAGKIPRGPEAGFGSVTSQSACGR
jgi:hypothetical protein